jgi:tRNA (mo5U34)-methyltransferase
MVSQQDVAALSESVGSHWWHSIDLGHGVITPGTKPIETMRAEIEALGLPADLTGKTVLDIGAWDGAFSFECERRGAQVTALDHFIWSVDLDAMQDYLGECARDGVHPLSWEKVPSVWKPDELPGKAGFDAAHEALGSSVEVVVDDFMTMDLDALGQFDIVLHLGVLYHMPDPFDSLCRVAKVTRDRAVIESEMLVVPGAEHYAVCQFLAFDELGGDPTNWWVPNRTGIEHMLRSAGFARVEGAQGPTALQSPPGPLHRRIEQTVRQDKTGVSEPYPDVDPIRYRGVSHAWK